MSDDELLALIEGEEGNCVSATTGELAEQRRKAMQYYYGKPYGDEVVGSSAVVTTEVKDAVEGILPSLMAIFTSSEEIVRFEPQGPEDEESAQQATDYVNYIFSRNNNGFLTLYCLFKDALLQKNGYAKVYWEDYTDQGLETYEGLNVMEITMMLQDSELELVEAEGEEGAEIYSKVVFRRTKKGGRVCIDPVPPEEILISRDTPNDITKARFVEHKTLKTISDVRKMGFKVEDSIADESDGADFNLERVERNSFDDTLIFRGDSGSNDPSTKQVWLCEAYLYVDFDKDGIAEYRKVTKIGKQILDNVEFDSLPVIGGTAILMPHKHYGLSIFDLVGDIQLIKSTITRTLLNNAYVQNQGRMVVLDGMVNMDDLLTVRPNGIIRAKAMNAVQRLDNPLLGAPFYNLLEYFDKVKTNRVGARDFGDAVDPDALNAKAHTAELVRNAAQERINLMARILAEGPVKALFWKILELVSKHQTKPQVVKLRGKWTQIDPREWKNKFNMTVTVGLGTGSQQAVMGAVNSLAGIMMGLLKGGYSRLITEQNAYHLGHTAAKALFPKDAELFLTNPASLPPPQPQPNIDMMELQLKAHKVDLQDQQKKDKMAFDGQLEQMRQMMEANKAQFQAMVDKATQERDHQAELMRLAVEADQQDRSRLVDALTQIKLSREQAATQSATEQSSIQLQGVVDSLLSKQEHHQTQMEKLLEANTEAALMEKEIVRDQKTGKATGVKPKKKDK